jgi:pseudaminic acid cytidylyltransferase
VNVALIPARGGSKRIPRKNIKEFLGKPIIAYSIEAAITSGCFEKVLVSTDDDEIAKIARDYGAEVPFKRPAELSDDYATSIEVVLHAINWLAEHDIAPENLCLLYATAPLVRAKHLRESLALLEATPEKQFCFSVTEYHYPIQRALHISAQGEIEMFQPEHLLTRSQDLKRAYHDAGQFYWGRTSAFLAGSVVFSSCSLPYILAPHQVQDIDTLEDWHRAELLVKLSQEQSITNKA